MQHWSPKGHKSCPAHHKTVGSCGDYVGGTGRGCRAGERAGERAGGSGLALPGEGDRRRVQFLAQ